MPSSSAFVAYRRHREDEDGHEGERENSGVDDTRLNGSDILNEYQEEEVCHSNEQYPSSTGIMRTGMYNMNTFNNDRNGYQRIVVSPPQVKRKCQASNQTCFNMWKIDYMKKKNYFSLDDYSVSSRDDILESDDLERDFVDINDLSAAFDRVVFERDELKRENNELKKQLSKATFATKYSVANCTSKGQRLELASTVSSSDTEDYQESLNTSHKLFSYGSEKDNNSEEFHSESQWTPGALSNMISSKCIIRDTSKTEFIPQFCPISSRSSSNSAVKHNSQKIVSNCFASTDISMDDNEDETDVLGIDFLNDEPWTSFNENFDVDGFYKCNKKVEQQQKSASEKGSKFNKYI